MSEEIEYIDHDAEVIGVNVEKKTVKVKISEDENCGECPAGKLCHNFSPDNDVMEISVANPSDYKVGDTVIVRGSEKLQAKAVMLINVIPTLAIIVVLIGVYLLTGSQLTAGLCALGALAFFFIGIFLIRHKLAREFVFTIVKPEEGEEK